MYQGKIPKDETWVTVVTDKFKQVYGRVISTTDEGIYIRSNGDLCWFHWKYIRCIDFGDKTLVTLTKEEFNYIDTDALNLNNLMSLYPTNMIRDCKIKHQLNNTYGYEKEYYVFANCNTYKLTVGDFVKLYIKGREYSEVGIFEGISDGGIMVYDDGGRTSTTPIQHIKAIGTFKKGE